MKNGETTLDKLFGSLRPRPEIEYPAPTTPCVEDNQIRLYVRAMTCGSKTNDATPSHVFGCEKCYKRFLVISYKENRAELLRETADLREANYSFAYLVKVLQDVDRPGWVRELAADHLGVYRYKTAIPALQHAAESDPDEDVREAASDAIKDILKRR